MLNVLFYIGAFTYNKLKMIYTFQNVSPQESGYYKCISKKLDGTGLLVGEVEMLVKGSAFTAMDAVKLVAIIVSIIVIVGCAVLYMRLRKEWRRYDGRVIIPGKLAKLYSILFVNKYTIILCSFS